MSQKYEGCTRCIRKVRRVVAIPEKTNYGSLKPVNSLQPSKNLINRFRQCHRTCFRISLWNFQQKRAYRWNFRRCVHRSTRNGLQPFNWRLNFLGITTSQNINAHAQCQCASLKTSHLVHPSDIWDTPCTPFGLLGHTLHTLRTFGTHLVHLSDF